ncbi:MAG: HAD family hydrolase [Ruminococcus sp.]|nr:HAD family hydrolase [Ruminococcus sp.]
MIVSFDLDDTLFVSENKFKTEAPLKFPKNIIYKERLRLGTVGLMRYIREQNIKLWIYTTSFRSERYIRGLFKSYGIVLDNVINGEKHAKEVQAGHAEGMPSKYPSKYRIDLHIDDDISVYQNGKIYGFNVFLVGGQDDEWSQKIIHEIERIKAKKN